MKLTSRQESQIFEASQAGIAPARIAELIGCTERGKCSGEVIAGLLTHPCRAGGLDEDGAMAERDKLS